MSTATSLSIFGNPNGAGLTNRLLIELDGAAFQRAACRASHMIVEMYHDGSFCYNPSGNNNYDTMTTPATGRKILAIGSDAAPVIPYLGGVTIRGTFMRAQVSIYRFAQAMGEAAPQLADGDGIPGTLGVTDPHNGYTPQFVTYSCIGGEAIHHNLIGASHGFSVRGSNVYRQEAKAILADFLLN